MEAVRTAPRPFLTVKEVMILLGCKEDFLLKFHIIKLGVHKIKCCQHIVLFFEHKILTYEQWILCYVLALRS